MKKILSLLICLIIIISVSGCTNEKVLTLTSENKSISISSNIDLSSYKLEVKEDNSDYSQILENVNRYVTYDISLGENITFDEEVEVSIKIPDSFSKDNLVVYYVKDNELKETYDVVIDNDKAKFKTKHFSLYMLAELKKEETENVNKTIQTEVETKVEEKVEPKIEEKVETKTETKVEEKIETKTETKVEVNQDESKEEPKVEEPKCIAKKFSKKYTYFASTKEECKNLGYNAIYELEDNGIMYDTFGCEEIKDDCGETYYGVYFNKWVGPNSDDYQKVNY